MRRSYFFILLAAFTTMAAWGMTGCGHSGGHADSRSPDTSTVGPAPDNNSANNPSLADTSYEKNRTRPITDTAKNADTLKNK